MSLFNNVSETMNSISRFVNMSPDQLLYNAVRDNNLFAARIALMGKTHINKSYGFMGKRLLHMCHSYSMAELLLQNGANPFRTDLLGRNAFTNKYVCQATYTTRW